MPETSGERWAVYYAPPAEHPLWQAGCRWLGRDPASGETFDNPCWLPPEEWQALVATPARYGFHGTLKPPMHLRPERSGDDLRRLVTSLASACTPFTLPPLSVQRIGDFLALQPAAESPALNALAAECVRALDGLRAPPTAEELARRRAHSLSSRQQSLLAAWGYPYVFEEFRFHLTLTGSLADTSADRMNHLQQQLAALFAPVLEAPLPVDSVAVYHQRARMPFRLIERVPLGAAP